MIACIIYLNPGATTGDALKGQSLSLDCSDAWALRALFRDPGYVIVVSRV